MHVDLKSNAWIVCQQCPPPRSQTIGDPSSYCEASNCGPVSPVATLASCGLVWVHAWCRPTDTLSYIGRFVKLYRAISNESVDGSCDWPHSSHGPPSRADHAGLRLARVRPSCGAITTHTCSARSTAVRIKHCADWIGRALGAAAVSGSGGGHNTRVMGLHVGLQNAVSADIPVWYTLGQISRAQSATAAAAGRF